MGVWWPSCGRWALAKDLTEEKKLWQEVSRLCTIGEERRDQQEINPKMERSGALLFLATEEEAPSLPAELQLQNECSTLGRGKDEQGPLVETSEPAEPEPNINKKCKRQLIGMCREIVKACLVLILLPLAAHLHGHQGHIRRDCEALGLSVKVTAAHMSQSFM